MVINGLTEGTTVHWHGIRLPNAMDGVPGLTQEPIAPGGSFTYAFTPPDAGTFWYHPHADTSRQLGRGLAGAFIVAEREPVAVDRDLLWFLQDWQLEKDGTIAPGFSNAMEAMMAGRIGNTVTLNGSVPKPVPVRAGERLRLRLVNASLARIMALRFAGHRPVVVALDGQPCDPHEPGDGRVLLGPAMRADLVLDAVGDPGQRYAVTDDFYGGKLTYTLLELAYTADAPVRAHPASTLRLPANQLPAPNLREPLRHVLRIQGGGMSAMGMGGMMGGGGMFWTINGASMHEGQAMKPLLTIPLGRTCVLDLRNETAWWHPMHLHGNSFRVLTRDGVKAPHREWGDTILLPPRTRAEVAFVADNPGNWMFHCHVTDHQESGLMAVFRVA